MEAPNIGDTSPQLASYLAMVRRVVGATPSPPPALPVHLPRSTLSVERCLRTLPMPSSPAPTFHRNLNPQGEAGVTGISPGTATAAVLSRTRQQLRLLNAGFLAAAWLSTAWVDAAVAALVGAPAGCLQLLLLVSIFTGGTRQLAALATPVRLEAELARERALMGRA